MSQFDFPRINFHGKAILDVPTANNGNYEPALTLFDQDESEAFLPPRLYVQSGTIIPPGIIVLKDHKGNSYVPITPVDTGNYKQWATTPMGSGKGGFVADKDYWPIYIQLQLTGSNPGYWSYFGDLSLSLVDVGIKGITIPNPNGIGVQTFTPQSQQGCPPELAAMFGSLLSFNNDYFSQGSKTTAYLCDVDSIGQMCTQIFYGQAGLYKTDGKGNNTTFFQGTPVKSTVRWMNLNRVLNYSDRSLIPMGGSACLYSMIQLNPGTEVASIFQKYTGEAVNCVFMKLNIHQVYEVRHPDYSQMPTKSIYGIDGNQTLAPKNPAQVALSGSITPWNMGDMKTSTISRIMKNTTAVPVTTALPQPKTKGGTVLSNPTSVNLAPVHFLHNQVNKLVSLDIYNMINEYGYNPGTIAAFAGDADIPPFQQFESYDYLAPFILKFQPDGGGAQTTIGTFDWRNNYNMTQFLATGGMVDLPVPGGLNYSAGYFILNIGTTQVHQETNIYITTDQEGIYAEQNQASSLYMSDGLPKVPCTLRVFYRGMSVSQSPPVSIILQAINMRAGTITNTPISVYDKMPQVFPVSADGCMTYGYVDSQSSLLTPNFSNLFQYAMSTNMIVLRTLASEPILEPYLNGQQPITWDVVYNNVWALYQVLYPVMDYVIPFTEANWSDSFVLSKMLVLIDESNWNQPLYMPITRDLSDPQRKLLQLWAKQNMSS